MQETKSSDAVAFQRQRTVRIKRKKELNAETRRNPLNKYQFAERWAQPNFYIEQREGQVLSRGMLLKFDIFPSSKIVRTDVSISGGPNYRRINEYLPLCAVGQPSIHGIRTILNQLIGSPLKMQLQTMIKNNDIDNLEDSFIQKKSIDRGHCVWLTLREEPVIYLNNRPFVLRDADHPFRNIQTFKGITWQHLREVEQRLKNDVLIEAFQHDNVLIHKENVNKQCTPKWEGITHQTVMTSEEAFSFLISEGYNVKYYRVPLTPESDFGGKLSIIDSIFKIVIKQSLLLSKQIPYFIINCQMGRGRSTLVTILLFLIFNKLGLVLNPTNVSTTGNVSQIGFNAFSPPPPRKLFRVPSTGNMNIKMSGIRRTQSSPNFQQMPLRRGKFKSNLLKRNEEIEENSREEHGDYEIIHRILRLLSNGKTAKENVDIAIEHCGALYNLRKEMAKCRLSLENAENNDEKELATLASQSVLSKYCTLLLFDSYLQSINIQELCNKNKRFDFENSSFSSWMSHIPSLLKIKADIMTLSFDDLMEKYRTKTTRTSIHTMLILNRIGSVLSANTILKADTRYTTKENEQLTNIRFRYLKEVGIATCAQPQIFNIKSILKNNKMDSAIWIDLREEPILYIDGNPYVVRNYNRPFQRLTEFDNLLTANQINNIAERLKSDIQKEAMDNDNKMLVHFETQFHELKDGILTINVKDNNQIQTTKQIFEHLRNEGYNISYKKLPFNPQNSLEPLQLERLGKVISSNIETHSTIIFNCSQGIHRSTVAAILSILISYHQGTLTYIDEDSSRNDYALFPLQSSAKMPLINEESFTDKNVEQKQEMELQFEEAMEDDTDIECRAVLNLLRILRQGLIMKRQVDNAIESFSEYYHIKHAIYESREKWENARTKEETQGYLQTAMRHLRTYTNLIIYNAYLYEFYYAKKYNETMTNKYKLLSFTEWIQSRAELQLWLKKMINNPQLALSMNTLFSYGLDDTAENESERLSRSQVFLQRGTKSSVLSGNAMLKIDYFPGCAQLQPNMAAENAINFRYINQKRGGVAGCAIPTIKAIQEIILFCTQQKWRANTANKKAQLHWICIREEPVLYVNEEPCVLREYSQPYENLIFTGITQKRVEAMEKALKEDAQKECAKFDNKLLIHSESDTGNLEAQWEVIQNTIMTCNEAYNAAFNAVNTNIDTSYHRIPVTDEEAPAAGIVDTFLSLFEKNSNDSIFIFNCQMGRGRTTTAMVIYTLWKRKVGLCEIISGNGHNELDQKEQSKTQAFVNGEFYAVLDLLRILPKGKRAKKWCDDVIDNLSHMQNLRKAIYKMKLRCEKAVSDKSKKHLAHRTQNYLQRYCLLIALTSYLLNDYKPLISDEGKDKNENNKTVTFEQWLAKRGAVRNCIYTASLEKD